MSFLHEFIIPRRPVSVQTQNKTNLAAWKRFVANEVSAHFSGPKIDRREPVQVTMVYLSEDSPVDVDNIIKPISDAMTNIVFFDDIQVTDVDAHRRDLEE